jgi:hypothetical protein
MKSVSNGNRQKNDGPERGVRKKKTDQRYEKTSGREKY